LAGVSSCRGCLRGKTGEIELRPKTFELLFYLTENAGRLISKDELVNAIWRNVIVSDDSLAQCVSELRNALNDSDRRIIKTVPRRGYIFAAAVSGGAAETLVAEHLQPVAVLLTAQQFRRALAHPFLLLTAEKPPMIEEELQQRQIV